MQFIGSKYQIIFSSNLSVQFNNIEAKLLELKSKYRDTDLDIRRLTDKKKMLVDLYKNQLLSDLKSRIEKIRYLESTSKNPKGTLYKIQRLIREASRNENILINLENNLRQIQLQKAKLEDPWKVITPPTLDKFPLSPEKNYRFYRFLIGVFTGIIISLIKERNKGIIYDQEELEDQLNSKVIEKIYLPEQKLFFNSKEVFLNEIIRY